MAKKVSNAEEIRNWVADNFNDVGEFRTSDVASNIEGVEIRASGNISASLQTWASEKLIVRGLRLRRMSDKGKAAIWICEKIGKYEATKKEMVESEVITVAAKSESFNAEIIHHDGTSRLVKHDGKLYKVTPFKY